MNDTLLTIGAIGLAVAIAMAITAWRIRRIQYPPELRWPTAEERAKEERAEREHRARRRSSSSSRDRQ
ncbi:hypothetical protein [Actomonas aquatica]|uniref:Uncharacterized protein n=1 Tax=Actomonas aquatica TaxID=2866162 RepID=A0ABZ1C394_9BACT|nr:hypothetical protein [Opitutus sp. WL0086]WRQ86159.1 hypothetical protein K1X11_015195 [Opitutus sp. WL0086]